MTVTIASAANSRFITKPGFAPRLLQLIEQDPGPRGSPHVPHAVGASAERWLEEETAKVDSRRSRSALLHDGQAGSDEA
jgi:hypothetical protein